jgi:hypothetical protein
VSEVVDYIVVFRFLEKDGWVLDQRGQGRGEAERFAPIPLRHQTQSAIHALLLLMVGCDLLTPEQQMQLPTSEPWMFGRQKAH